MLNNMLDEILANPEQYAAVRAKYIEMGAPEELLPEQFDPQFFAAMNMAVDQLIAEPAGVQAFAQGGIAELKPIAKAIASYGRNGDTMLAHITPAEARMLRRRGGSGTINPATGLPEFFLKKAFKSLGKAVKSFASSTVGKIVTTVALGFFLGPAAASFMGVTSAAGVAAVGGFIGGAGSTLLGGGSLKDALKAGAIGGLTAGAVGGVTQGFDTAYAGPTTVSGQVDSFTKAVSGVQAPTIDAAGQTRGLAPTDVTQAPYKPLEMTGTPSKPFDSYFGSQPPAGPLPGQPGSNVLVGGKPAIPSFSPEFAAGDPGAGFEPYNKVFADAPARVRAPVNFVETPAGANEQVYRAPSSGMADVTTNTARDLTRPAAGMADITTNTARDLTRPADTSYFDQAKDFYKENFSPSNIQQQGATNALSTVKAQFPGVTTEQIMSAPANSALGKAYATAMPGVLATYGPITAAGIGALALGGGFKSTPAQPSAMRDQLMKPVTQRIAEGGNQRNYYIQGLPGVKYDQYGAPIAGEYAPLQTFNTGLGIESLIPKGYAAGGEVTAANFDEIAYKIAYPDVAAAIAKGDFENAYQHYERYGKAEGRTAFNKAETAAAAAKTDTATKAKQETARNTVAATKAAKKAKGSTSAYQNINAGLAYDAPEGYAANAIASRQAAFAPTLNKFIDAGAANTATLAKPYSPTVVEQPYNKFPGYEPPTTSIAPPVVTAPITRPTPVTPPPVTPPPVTPVDPATTKMLADRAAFQALNRGAQDKQIRDYVDANQTATDQTYAKYMDYFGIKAPQITELYGMQNLPAGSVQSIDARYAQAAAANAGDAAAIAAQNRANAVTNQDIQDYVAKNPGLSDMAYAKYMDANQIDASQAARALAGTPFAIKPEDVLARYQAATANPEYANQKLLNKGGIATLGTGGYPRRTGQINGPGTATSDSIPAMLSDGEFVMTAKAVRGAGKGDRRAGAKRMYALMNQLEKNAARG
jgi:hypothetical protein